MVLPFLMVFFNKVDAAVNFLKEIPKATFLGWPIIKSIGGKCVDDYLTKDEKYVISKEDRHPNAKGHELISEILYDKYNQNYS